MSYKLLSLNGRVVSAPLANISCSGYRLIARSYGAALTYSEMISVDGLVRGNQKTIKMLKFRKQEQPVCIQLFGHDPDLMYDAAQMTAETGCDMIDINLGCPAKKVIKNYNGAALTKDLNLMEKLISAVVKAVSIPVSVKFRSGWDNDNLNYLEVGEIAENCGASYLVLHPRTRSAGFRGKSNWQHIRELKQAVKIPVIGSGDVTSPEDARRMIDETGCDLVMIGRAAMGAPWLFQRVDTYLKTGDDPGEPSQADKIKVMLKFARLMIEDFGESAACLKLRKHLAWLTRGWKYASQMRPRMFSVASYDDIENILNEYLNLLRKVA